MGRADEFLLPGVYKEVGLALHVDPTALGSLTLIRSIGWDVLAKWLPNYGRIALSQTSSGIFIPLTAILLLALRDYSFQGICSWLALVRNGEHNVKRASYEQRQRSEMDEIERENYFDQNDEKSLLAIPTKFDTVIYLSRGQIFRDQLDQTVALLWVPLFIKQRFQSVQLYDKQTRPMETGGSSNRKTRFIDQVEVARYLQGAYDPQTQASERNKLKMPRPILETLDEILIPPGRRSEEICRQNKIIGGMFFPEYRTDQRFPDLVKFRKEFTKETLTLIDAIWWNHSNNLKI
ncbi:hypothetical protein LguiB_032676 [Lonicera macranthoides]